MGKTLSAVNKYFNKLPCPTLITTPKGPVLPQNALSTTYSGEYKKNLHLSKK